MKTMSKSITAEKEAGRFYTPAFIVEIILDLSGYYGKKILDKHVMDNSCGDGAFLCQIVNRYCKEFLELSNDTTLLKKNFQIFIIFEKIPYYKAGGAFEKYDILTEHHLEKYFALSKDDPSVYLHTPDKTLLIVLNLKEKAPSYKFVDSKDYSKYYNSVINDCDLLSYSKRIKDIFDDSVILNDYETFIKKSYYISEGRTK